ncbi:MAG TPA: aconitase/3-isopropylmalate dehydratase large subunit family protein [Micromonosporaceae bacterium]|nr:aconitase/3-isopropylmalate dehydratase large subunit family protein [Micromonosporaceae bacterium]
MTLAEEIIAAHAGVDRVVPGQIATVTVDQIYLQDGNVPTIRRLFDEWGFTAVAHPERIAAVYDHSVLAADSAISTRLRESQRFAESIGITTFPIGRGISHVVALEEGWYRPGGLVVATDSHTCTGGVMQCLALGMGATDVLAAMLTGQTWLRVPQTRWVGVKGTPSAAARTKDVMLYALARFGQDPFLYRSVEWFGDWLGTLTPDAAATIANMAVEMGAKCAFLPPGPGRTEGLRELAPPPGADPAHVLELDVADLPPFVSRPHSPLDAVPLEDCSGQDIDYVFIGSCANGRLEDLREVADVLARTPVHPRVHCVVTPGSQEIYLRALETGVIETLIRAGALVTPAGCGACVGTQGTVPAAGDRVLTTMNRNFRGRMGSRDASIWLASPLVAACTAAYARIPQREELPC